MKIPRFVAAFALLALAGAGCAGNPGNTVTSFEECVAAGNPVLESYPRQCRANGMTFVERVSSATGTESEAAEKITSFEECVAAGNPIMKSNPPQCSAGGRTFYGRGSEGPDRLPDNAYPEIYLGQEFLLIPGQDRTIRDGGPRVTLLEIIDSRCKPDVQCIWAGELSARLRLEGPKADSPVREVSLGTVRNRIAEDSGYRLELKDATEAYVKLVVTK